MRGPTLVFLLMTLISKLTIAGSTHPMPYMHVDGYSYQYTLFGLHHLCEDHPEVCSKSPWLQSEAERLEIKRKVWIGSLISSVVGAGVAIAGSASGSGDAAKYVTYSGLGFLAVSLGTTIYEGVSGLRSLPKWVVQSGGKSDEPDNPGMW